MTGGAFTLPNIYYGRTHAYDLAPYREAHHLQSFAEEEDGLHQAVTSTAAATVQASRPFHNAGNTNFEKNRTSRWEEGHQAKDAGQRKGEYRGKKTAARAAKRKAALGDVGEDSEEETAASRPPAKRRRTSAPAQRSSDPGTSSSRTGSRRPLGIASGGSCSTASGKENAPLSNNPRETRKSRDR